MRKNSLFFLFFVLTFAAVYYFEKIAGEDERLRLAEQQKIFNVKELGVFKGVRTKKYWLEKRSDRYWIKELGALADQSLVERMLNFLGHIKAVRYLSSEVVGRDYLDFFPKNSLVFDFLFAQGELNCTLGAKLNHDQSFYLAIKRGQEKKILIARVDLPLEGIFSAKDEINSDEHYKKLQTMISADQEFFVDRRVIKLPKELQEIFFSHDQITLWPTKLIISPAPFSGITVDRQAINMFLKDVVEMRAAAVIPPASIKYHRNQLKGRLAAIDFKTEQHRYRLVLFRKYMNQPGWYILNEQNNYIYIVERSASRLFFQRAQNFWNKRLAQDREISAFSLEYEGQWFSFIHKNVWRLVADHAREIDQTKIADLIKIFYRSADVVEKVEDQSRQFDNYRQLFRIKLFSSVWNVLESQGDLLFWNKQQGIVFHYWPGQKLPFDEKFENYLL